MKYCRKCGNEVDDDAVICPKCGCAVTENEAADAGKKDAKSFGFALLGFFIPIVGLILYLVWKNETPLKAKSAGKGALMGVIVSAILVILVIVYICISIALYGAFTLYPFVYVYEKLFGMINAGSLLL